MTYIYITSKDELRLYLKNVEDKKHYVIALDIEAELFLHAYGEKLCLIQIFDGVKKILIDPFNIDNYTLKILFENKNVLKVMYDASSDLSLLKNIYNIEVKSILDLRPAVDLLDYDKKDLHSILAFELGVNLEKKKKYQKHNWTRRPIDKGAINYALNDVIHLLKLKDAILKKLYTARLLDIFILKNLQIQGKDYTRHPGNKYKRLRGYNSLTEYQKAVFQRVYDIRDKHAKRYNMPPHNIINNNSLINIVQDTKYIDEIRFPKRFGNDLIQSILHELKNAVKSPKNRPD